MDMKNKNKPKRRRSKRSDNARNNIALRTTEDFFAQTEANQATWDRVLRVITKMRSERVSLSKAAKEAGLTPRTVINWGGRALKKRSNGRYTVTRTDSLLRVLQVPTPDGARDIAVRSSRAATTLGKYWDAVQKYLRTGDGSVIKTFIGKHIKDASGQKVPLITELAELKRLGSAGVLSFETIYARTA